LPCLPHHAETQIGGDSAVSENERPVAPPRQSWNRTAEIVAVCLLVLLSAAVRIHHLDYDPLWIDELITAQHSSGSFGDVLNSLRHSRPAKMPLDFLVRSAALRVRHSEAALRAPSVVFGVLAVVALYFFARALFGNRPLAFLIALVLCINPTAVHYSQEARFYGWTIWMAIAIADVFWRLAEKPAWTTALWLFAAVSVGLLVNYLLATVVLAAGIWYVGQLVVRSLRNRDWRTVGREIALAAIPVAAAVALLVVYLLPQRGFGAADFFHQKAAWDWSLFPKFLGYVRTDFLPPVKYGAMTRRLDWWLHGLTLAGLGAGVLLWRRQVALLAAAILSYWLIALATYRIDLALTFRYVCHLAPFVLLLMVAGAFGLAEGVGRFVAKRRRALVSGSAACLFVAPLLAHQWLQLPPTSTSAGRAATSRCATCADSSRSTASRPTLSWWTTRSIGSLSTSQNARRRRPKRSRDKWRVARRFGSSSIGRKSGSGRRGFPSRRRSAFRSA
jgi:4-amino-4-deoxy-L-arabinose transferase-like glycosyltransferase